MTADVLTAPQSLRKGPESLGTPAAPCPRLHGARRALPDGKASGVFRSPAHAPGTALSAMYSPERAANAFGDAGPFARPSEAVVADSNRED